MAAANATEVFNCSVEEFYKIVTDYENYPKFLDEVKSCRVIEKNGDRQLVEFTINVVKNFTYSLWMDHSKPNEVHWTLGKGDLFKESKGHWILKEEAGKTRANYGIEAKFSLFVPGPITKALISVNLPNMMSSFKKRVAEVYGK